MTVDFEDTHDGFKPKAEAYLIEDTLDAVNRVAHPQE
jgi:hypothetical protein